MLDSLQVSTNQTPTVSRRLLRDPLLGWKKVVRDFAFIRPMHLIQNNVKHIFFPIDLRDWQKKVMFDNKQFIHLLCHRRAGKTYFCVLKAIISAMLIKKKNPKYWYMFPTEKQGKENVWEYIKSFVGYLPNAKIAETTLTASFDFEDGFGRRAISIKGADGGAETKRGAYLDGVIIDETKDMPHDLLTVISPMLLDRNGWIVITGTAQVNTYWHDLWTREEENENSIFTQYNYPASVSGVFSKEELEYQQYILPKSKYDQEFNNNWYAIVAGSYYAATIKNMILENKIGVDVAKYNPNKPVITSWDLGTSDLNAVWFWQVGDEPDVWHAVDYMEENETSVLEKGELLEGIPFHLQMFRKAYKKGYRFAGHILPWDSKIKSGSASYSTYHLFKNEDPQALVTVAPKMAKEISINIVQGFLGKTRINKTACHYGINSLHSYRAKLNKTETEAKPLHDKSSHGAEAFGYFVTAEKEVFKILRRFHQPKRQQEYRQDYTGFNFNKLT